MNSLFVLILIDLKRPNSANTKYVPSFMYIQDNSKSLDGYASHFRVNMLWDLDQFVEIWAPHCREGSPVTSFGPWLYLYAVTQNMADPSMFSLPSRQILNSVWQRRDRWIGHIWRHDGLLHEIIEGRMTGKPRRGRRRIQMQRVWQTMMAMGLCCNQTDGGWRRIETQRKDVKNLLYSRKLLYVTVWLRTR